MSEFEQLALQLATAGRRFDQRGWTPATSSNFSARLQGRLEARLQPPSSEPAADIVITRSGCHKGQLTVADFMPLDLDGRSPEAGARPSAEAGLHCMLYRRDAGTGAVLHTHSVAATVLSMVLADEESVTLRDYELLKGFAGIATHAIACELPVVANDQDIDALAARVVERLPEQGGLPAFLIRGHGAYVWGSTIAECTRHVEALEFILECELHRMRLKS